MLDYNDRYLVFFNMACVHHTWAHGKELQGQIILAERRAKAVQVSQSFVVTGLVTGLWLSLRWQRNEIPSFVVLWGCGLQTWVGRALCLYGWSGRRSWRYPYSGSVCLVISIWQRVVHQSSQIPGLQLLLWFEYSLWSMADRDIS